MAQRTSAENIRIEPVHASWEQPELTKVTCVADVAGSLGGTSLTLAGGEKYVWFDTGADTDPAPAGLTGIEVTINSGDSASAVATALAAAVTADTEFQSVVDPKDATSVFIQNKAPGAVSAAVDVDTDFTIAQVREGSQLFLGFIDGDVSVGLSEDLADVTAHQTGSQIIQALRTGRNIANVSLPLKESDAAKLKAIIEASGVEYTPVGTGATPVSAWGSEDVKAFGNISGDCRKLVLHPVRKPEADLSEDMCFFRAYPILSGLALSGESPRMINLEFKIIPDELLVKEARQFVLGDHSQNFLAS